LSSWHRKLPIQGNNNAMNNPFASARSHEPRSQVPMPEARTAVRLLAADGQPIPARVLAQNGRSLTLATVLPVPVFSRQELDGLTLEFSSRYTRVRLTGHFSQMSIENPELLQLIGAERRGRSSDERFHARVRAELPATMLVHGGSAPIRGKTVDVSGGGFLLAGAESLCVDDEVAFEIYLDELGPAFKGTARVVRLDGTGARGLVYDKVEIDEWARVADFVASRLGSSSPQGAAAEPPQGLRGAPADPPMAA
jgi:hypothetical protein